MFCDNKRLATRIIHAILFLALTLLLTVAGPVGRAQAPDFSSKLNGFDSYMEQVLKDWNTPGIGVGIVINDKLVFANGYGYRDYEKKLPFTPTTLCQIASNSKPCIVRLSGSKSWNGIYRGQSQPKVPAVSKL